MEIREVAGRTAEMEPLFDSIEADLTAVYGEDAAVAHVAGVRRLAGLLPGYLALDDQTALGLVLFNQTDGRGRIAFARSLPDRPTILAELMERAVAAMRARGAREISADEEYAGQSVATALCRLGFRPSERLNMTLARPLTGTPDWPLGFRLVNWREELFGPGARVLFASFKNSPDARWDGQLRTPEGAAHVLRGIAEGKYGPLDGELSFLLFERSTPCGIALVTRRPASAGYILALGITPPYRRRGLGRALVYEAAERILGAGLDRVELTVSADNEVAVSLYSKLGFAVDDSYSVYVWSDQS